MHPARAARTALLVVVPAAALVASAPLSAQAAGGARPPSPVGVTQVRSHSIRASLELTGSVEARQSSLVASEVPGLVVRLAAREGDVVARGATLVELRQTHLELERQRVAADLGEANARLDLAERSLARTSELFDSLVVSRQALDDAVSESTAWEGRVASLEAQLARVDDDLEQSSVEAPFAGVVVREHTQVGEWIGVGDPVTEMVSLDDLEVVVEVPEQWFDRLDRTAEARVRLEALPGVEVEGRVSAVVPRADPQARTFPVKIRIPNPGRRIGVGMLARVELPAGERVTATIVPKDAVVQSGGQEYVLAIDGDGKVERIAVVTGGAAGQWVEVRRGIEAGRTVIVRGNERVLPGQAVTGEPVEYELP